MTNDQLPDICIPIENEQLERLFLKSFYHHHLFDGLSDLSKLCCYSERDLSNEVLRLLSKYSCKDIISIIKEDSELYPIDKGDIPQFSDLGIAFYNVPYILLNCGIDGVGYAQMGYTLRQKRRSEVADRKYGENHIKTAAQLGLCKIWNYKSYPTELGKLITTLEEKERQSVLPKLCLYIPFIQNYYVADANEDFLNKQLSILSPSTINRRRPNINTLIQTINKAVKDGI